MIFIRYIPLCSYCKNTMVRLLDNKTIEIIDYDVNDNSIIQIEQHTLNIDYLEKIKFFTAHITNWFIRDDDIYIDIVKYFTIEQDISIWNTGQYKLMMVEN